jgi:hypothetical protein
MSHCRSVRRLWSDIIFDTLSGRVIPSGNYFCWESNGRVWRITGNALVIGTLFRIFAFIRCLEDLLTEICCPIYGLSFLLTLFLFFNTNLTLMRILQFRPTAGSAFDDPSHYTKRGFDLTARGTTLMIFTESNIGSRDCLYLMLQG